MFPVLQIGPLALQTPGLLALFGIWIGLSAAERYASWFSIESSRLYNLVLIGLVAGVIGARVGYILQFSSIFLASPLSILSLTPTMLNAEAGLIFGLVAGAIYIQRKSLPVWQVLDALTPGLAVFMIFFHLANFASGNAFGAPAEIPFSIDLWGQLRHPVQLYEMAAAILITLALLPRKERHIPAGALFWSLMGLSALARLFLDFFRGDSATILGNIHIAQLVSWIILALSFWQFGKRQESSGKIMLPERPKENEYDA